MPDDVLQNLDRYHSRLVVGIDSMALKPDGPRKGNLVMRMQTGASSIAGWLPQSSMERILFSPRPYFCRVEDMGAPLIGSPIDAEYHATRTAVTLMDRAHSVAPAEPAAPRT